MNRERIPMKRLTPEQRFRAYEVNAACCAIRTSRLLSFMDRACQGVTREQALQMKEAPRGES